MFELPGQPFGRKLQCELHNLRSSVRKVEGPPLLAHFTAHAQLQLAVRKIIHDVEIVDGVHRVISQHKTDLARCSV